MNIKLLVVDDNEDIRGLVKMAFRSIPVEIVGEAENGREAIEQVRALRPDVVLMDILMPEMDGIEATRVLRDEFPDVIVFGFTSSGTRQMAEMIDAGAKAVFEKMGFGELVAQILNLES